MIIELLDIECALSRDRVQFDKNVALINPPFRIFFKNYRLFLHKMSWGRANFALINPPFCGDNFLTDTR